MPGSWTIADANRFFHLFSELERRQAEPLSLYVALPVAEQMHACLAHEVGLKGANRAGKTQGAAVEVARALTGLHPIASKYPQDGGVQVCAVGFDQRHTSLMYEYLFQPGQFRVFRHPGTGKWQVVVPDDPEHKQYEKHWQKSGPLIPARLVKEVAWEDTKAHIPKLVRLHDGSTIHFYSGMAIGLPKGRRFHLVWMDEEIDDADKWLKELRPRLIDFNGRLLWSATAQSATPTYRELFLRSQEPDNLKKPLSQQVAFFTMLATDNIYLSKEGTAAFADKLANDPLEMRIRIRGDFAYDEMLVFPEYQALLHRKETFPLRWDDTLYVLFDPGIALAGVLFVLCPAPAKPRDRFSNDFEEFVRKRQEPTRIAFDELYIRNANATMVANLTRNKIVDHGGHRPHDFTIDLHGGRNKWGDVRPIMEIYASELKRLSVVAEEDGWRHGAADVKTGIEKIKQDLMNSPIDHKPTFFVMDRCRWLHHEMISWKKKYGSSGQATGYEDANHHLIDLVRYGVMRGLQWITPPDRLYKGSGLTTTKLKQMGSDLLRGKVFTRFKER